jgi:hypothetical protein
MPFSRMTFSRKTLNTQQPNRIHTIYKATEVTNNKNVLFNEQNCIFEHCSKVKTAEIVSILFSNNCSVYLYRATLSQLTVALRTDVLIKCYSTTSDSRRII